MSRYPAGLPLRYRPLWRNPQWKIARNSKGFRRWLLSHGRLSPHFTLQEAACHDGTPVPLSMRWKAQHHSFNLERLRHALGEPTLPVLSWYRDPAYNTQIGGASQSKHMDAIATDFDLPVIAAIGREKFDRVADQIFRNGGFGTYPGGSRHVDSRGYRARWSSF